MSSTSALEKRFRLIRGKEQQLADSFARDVRIGLTATPKFLLPKYFYDEKGSELFDRICELPEYYPTRTEAAILEQNAEHIIGTFGKIPPELVELGSGSSTKIRYLIEACLRKKTCLEYITIDISETALTNGANQLLADYPQLYITALVGEYQVALENLQQLDAQKRLFLWLGSTIGNFEPREAIQFLKLFRQYMRPGDYFLIGADLQKDVKILEKAYNDSQGVTAAFNLNLLKRINREFDANFDLTAFRHQALYNQKLNRIEMHLMSLKDQTVKIRALDLEVRFVKNESIHTENSYKFSVPQLHEIARQAGFAIESQWFDDARWFSEILLKPL